MGGPSIFLGGLVGLLDIFFCYWTKMAKVETKIGECLGIFHKKFRTCIP